MLIRDGHSALATGLDQGDRWLKLKQQRPHREVWPLLRSCLFRWAYRVRQLELVRARMPMKLGTKTVAAEKKAIAKVYIRVSPVARAVCVGAEPI